MILNQLGVVDEEWRRAPLIRPMVHLDAFVVMPNHLHGILQLLPAVSSPSVEAAVGRPGCDDGQPGPESRSLGAILGGFKAVCTGRINRLRETPRARVWQRNYFERVIRDETELMAVRRYIENNPVVWGEDEENPERP
jgi:putative transposase